MKGKHTYMADTLSRAALKQHGPSAPQEEVFSVTQGDTQELFRTELESVQLSSPGLQQMYLRGNQSGNTRRPSTLCLSCVSLWLMVGRPTNPMFQQCSVIISHAGMSWQYIMVVISMQLQSTMVSKVHQGHQVGESRMYRAKCCIGRECVEQFFKKEPVSLCGCRMKFHMVLGSSSQKTCSSTQNGGILWLYTTTMTDLKLTS